MGVAHPREEIAVAQYHALRLARGPRRVHEHRRSVGQRPFDQGISQFRLGTQAICTDGLQLFPRNQSGIRIVGQAAWLVVNDVLDRCTLIAQIKHLVDLLLVFSQDKADMRLMHEVTDFVGCCSRVDGHRVAAQHAGREHAHVEPGSVVAQDQQGILCAKTQAFHAGRAGERGIQHLRPGGLLPYSQVLFAHGHAIAQQLGVASQNVDEGGVGAHIPCGLAALGSIGFSALHAHPPGRP
ncbi:hypothetical protein Y695_00586 [Hydrogenophaga sp. T4]|nr:hypothetical protein Y695_00586 [Hydrogenophaga sp. T4]